MTLSIWRYSHLVLAIVCSLFLVVVASTGIILSINSVQNRATAKHTPSIDTITLATALPVLQKNYMQVTELSVDKYEQVQVKAIDDDGKDVIAIVDPATGKVLGKKPKKSEFIETITSLHRSLFLHEVGRVFIGITAFCLFLISISGIILVIQRQQGLRRFFGKIVKEYFSQYYHVVFGRLMLIPILVLSLTGTYLTMKRYHLLPEKNTTQQISKATTNDDAEVLAPSAIDLFKQTKLKDVKSLELPFSEDPEEHYTLKLQDREMTIDQFSGKVLQQVRYPFTEILRVWSLKLHTGRSSIIWSIILGIAALNILFFIYSGFVITFRRRANRIKNKFKAADAGYIILVGSENGSTLGFANAIYEQLLANGKKPFVAELNQYALYPKATHLVVMTSTYGLGDAPTNANKFETLLQKLPQRQQIKTSVVAFGSHAYPDFCGFGKKVNDLLSAQSWADNIIPIHTVADKSAEDFNIWVRAWAEKTEIPLVASAALYTAKPKNLQSFIVLEKQDSVDASEIFTLKLRLASRGRFTSGDLLVVYPGNDHRERFYSIGKIGKDIQLVIRKLENGLGSTYLHELEPGDIIKARVVANPDFQFPTKSPSVIMIANGTGIAPFLGMITHNEKKVDISFYGGFRTEEIYRSLAGNQLDDAVKMSYLKQISLAYSREGEKQYVTDLLSLDAETLLKNIESGAVVMICGSLSMGKDVVALLDTLCMEKLGHLFSIYKEKGQLKMDCY